MVSLIKTWPAPNQITKKMKHYTYKQIIEYMILIVAPGLLILQSHTQEATLDL